MSIKEKIHTAADAYFNEVTDIRHHLHAHPEVAFEEYQTSAFIASKLKAFNIPYKTGIAKTGIVAMIEGKEPNSCVVALRADMDALPIQEQNDISYRSQTFGVMHACGHDVHMACLLGAAKILSELTDEFCGSIKLIFQPSEEKLPGGASMMIREGVLKNPDVNIMIGQHVLPTIESGKMGIKSGLCMASNDEIYITIKGKGGHAATPDLIVNPLIIAANILLYLQQIERHLKNPETPFILSFGRMIADGQTNVIPNEVKLEGTLRTFDEKWRVDAHKHITDIALKTAKNMNGECEVFINSGYPSLINDERLSVEITRFAVEYLGEENVVNTEQRMTSEDFAYYSQLVPSVFYRLGVKHKETNNIKNLHTSAFDIDEYSIKIGMGLMAWLAISCLKK